MTDWPVLDVALGLTLVYTAASLLCSSLNEAAAALLARRAGFLEKWLRNVLTDPDAPAKVEESLDSFYQHPLIQPLVREATLPRPGQRRPSYLPASTFVSALLNLDPGDGTGKRPLDDIVKALPPSHAKRVVATILQEVGHNEKALRSRLETWYDESMERVSGWYKRRTQIWLALIGLSAACLLNIDTVQIADTLWAQPNVRSAVVASAGHFSAQSSAQPSTQSITDTVNYLNSLNAIKLPIGWDGTAKNATHDPRAFPSGLKAWAAKVAGILITTLALLLGAPFWFQLLGKLVNLKSAGPTPSPAAVEKPQAGEAT